jgi:DNA-binding protein H-NS
MKPSRLEALSLDELWSFRERVDAILARKMAVEKAKLDQRLRQLAAQQDPEAASRSRRPYPPVFPKYMNPTEPSETWSGRGKLPRWLSAQLRSGKQLDDFRIPPSLDRGLRVVHQH